VEGLLVGLLIIVLIGLVIAAVANAFIRRVTVHDYERGVRYANGRFTGLLEAGTYTVIRSVGEIRVLDARPTWLLVEGQEVPTSDGVPLKVSIAARHVVGDAVTTVLADQDHRRALYLVLQLALRDAIAKRSLEEALTSRSAIGQELMEQCAPEATKLGLELLAVAVRDVMLPGELKRAYASVLAARKEGEATLERARGETAALRNLANAGKLVDDSPGLLRLRAIQQVGQSSGNTIMLGLDGGSPTSSDARAAGRQSRRAAPTSGDGSPDDR
jgi:regulator of protease activity HflC (stomatin/prohibitin superfamily)